MSTSNKNLKSPKELFEEKRLQALVELEYQKVKEIESLISKKILPPKYFFSDSDLSQSNLEEVSSKNFVEETDQNTSENDQTNLYEEQIVLLKNKLSEIEESIPEEVDLTEIIKFINQLKDKVDNIPKPKDYSEDIENIRTDLIRIESNIPDIPEPEVFDPSDLYLNISVLKNKIEEVRSEIPTIPQPILYDDQLEELKIFIENVKDSIPVIPEIRYYEDDLNFIIETISQLREEIPEIPEIKYYDEQISLIENRLTEIQNSIPTVPEVKYYDEDIKNVSIKVEQDVKVLKFEIEEVKNSIPTVPEVKYYDEDVKVLKSEIEEVKNSIPTVPEVKYYDTEITSLNEELKSLCDKISSIKIPDENVYFQKVKALYSSFEEKNTKLLEKINYLEEVFEKFNEKTILQEDLSEPPEVKNSDPLTPLDQNYVTIDQLQQHYRLFINRIQQQLASIGGGGETQLKYLDDIVGIATNASAYDGKFLKYNHSIKKFEFVTVSGGGGGGGESYWTQSGVGIVTTTNVGINTDNPTSALTVNGDAIVVGVMTATDFNSASDINLKKNISTIDNPLDKIIKLEGVNFQWKESGKKSLGVIAQEVEKVLPELVSGENTKTVNYNGIVGLLIECIKKQQEDIEELKRLINK